MMDYRALICAGAIVLCTSAPSFALASWFPNKGGNNNGGGSVTHSAPGPVIGIGLPAFAVLGGYVWYRRKQKQNKR